MLEIKRKISLKRVLLFLLSIAILGMVCICVYAYTLMNNPDVITIGNGESYTLKGRESDFLIRSYNADVVTVSTADTVTGHSIGEAVVCLKYTYFDRDFYRFRVIDAPTSVSINETEIQLGVGEAFELHCESKVNDHSFELTFESSDPKIATVSQNGTITAKKVGECSITATTYNGKKASCAITISNAPKKLSLTKNSLTMGESETFALAPKFSKNEYSNTISYTSDNENVATVSQSGTVTGKGVGECVITAKCFNDVSAQCKVKLRKLPDKINLVLPQKHSVGTDIKALYSISDDCAASDITLSVSDTSVVTIDEKDPMLLHCKKQGEATVTITLKNGVSDSKTITVGNYNSKKISFSSLNQFPSLPTGCEVVSLTSVLRHYGFDVSMTTMADKYMPKKEYGYFSVSPHDYFYGTPYTWDGFGCFSGCIVKTAHNYFDDKKIDNYVAVDITGCTPEELYDYLENGVPVITWCTSNFVTPTVDGRWTVKNETITWCNHEHCLVTTGYDKNAGLVYVADNSGGYSYSLSMSQYEKVFKGMGSMAVVVLKTD